MSTPVASLNRTGECDLDCRQAPWIPHYLGGELVRLSVSNHQRGDVRRCKHGAVWFCEGRHMRSSYLVSGFWSQLHPVWTPIRYRRAVIALSKEASK